jgi:hypothetical protein
MKKNFYNRTRKGKGGGIFSSISDGARKMKYMTGYLGNNAKASGVKHARDAADAIGRTGRGAVDAIGRRRRDAADAIGRTGRGAVDAIGRRRRDAADAIGRTGRGAAEHASCENAKYKVRSNDKRIIRLTNQLEDIGGELDRIKSSNVTDINEQNKKCSKMEQKVFENGTWFADRDSQ